MRFLLESKRDDYLNQYVELLNQRGMDTNLGELKGYLLKKFSSEFGMYNLSKQSNYYLAGVTRYYFEGKLTSNSRLNIFYPKFKDKPIPEVCKRLDALVEILRNAYIDSVGTTFEQPEDFGNLPIEKLLRKYGKKIDKELGIGQEKEDKTDINQDVRAGRNYTYEVIYNYGQVQKYNEYTRPGAWCITYGQQHYNAYIKRLGGIHYVVFKRNGFENVPRNMGKGFTPQKPHDEYGNSLICVLQSNSSPEPIYITSRWNHGSSDTPRIEADHAYTKEEFLKVIGSDESVLQRCYDQWKANYRKNNSGSRMDRTSVLRKFKYALMLLQRGGRLTDIFSGVRIIERNEKNIQKSLCLVAVKDNEMNYWTILDRGKLMYDSLIVKDEYGPHPGTLTDGLYEIENYIYSTKKRSVLSADGVSKFKHISYHRLGGYSNRYVLVAASGNQIAVLDTKIGDFMKSPNGDSIFEAVRVVQRNISPNSVVSNRGYNGNIILDSIDEDEGGYMVFCYDSSAMEYYIYDIARERFTDLQYAYDINGKRYYLSLRNHLNDYVQYTQLKNPQEFLFSDRESFFLNMETGEMLDILGHRGFIDARYVCDGKIIAFQPYGVKLPKYNNIFTCDYFYDVELGDYVRDENGEPVACRVHVENINNYSDWLLIKDPCETRGKLYNPYTHSILSINGETVFNIEVSFTDKETLLNREPIESAKEYSMKMVESKRRMKVSLTEEQFFRIFGNKKRM